MKIDPDKVAALEWINQAMDMPAWKKLWGSLEKDAAQMKASAMSIPEQPSILESNLLTMCGLKPPSTPEEQVQVFLAFRAVSSYIEKKQALLSANRDIYREGLRQLQEEDKLETEPQVNLTSKT